MEMLGVCGLVEVWRMFEKRIVESLRDAVGV